MTESTKGQRTREEVSAGRVSLFMGPILGLFIYGALKGFNILDGTKTGGSLLFTDTSSWPDWVRSFLPFDILVAAFGGWFATRYLYWMISHLDQQGNGDPDRPVHPLYALAIVPMLTGMGVSAGVAYSGWLFAIPNVLATMLGIVIFVLAIVALYWVIDKTLTATFGKIGAFIKERFSKEPSVLSRANSWFEAKDVPNAQSEDRSDS